MPEALPEAHTLVAAEHDLATYLADGQVDQTIIARVAGKSGGTTEDMRRSAREVPAERASEEIGLGLWFDRW